MDQTITQALTPFAVCPSCHTDAAALTMAALAAGGYWTCARCSHTWDAGRLATAAAYESWASDRLAGTLTV